MKTNAWRTLALLVSATALLGCQGNQTAAKDPNMGAAPTAAPTAATASIAQVDDQTRDALIAALADERRAHATYEAVAAKFGEARPFSNIVNAERRHESFLLPLFEKYKVTVPENEFTKEKVVVPATLADACRQAVEGEKANIRMYERFLVFAKESDIRETFTYLRDASNNNHLPAFERCLTGRGPRRN
ncbi:MAG TPA: ferritin family protein [Pyrinomonadaceae bacterium]